MPMGEKGTGKVKARSVSQFIHEMTDLVWYSYMLSSIITFLVLRVICTYIQVVMRKSD